MKRFFDGVAPLYKEGRKLIGTPEAMSLKAQYTYWIPDDLSQAYFKTVEVDAFQFDWKSVAESEFKSILEKKRTTSPDQRRERMWCILSPAVYSWSQQWLVMVKSMALKVIGWGKDTIALYREI